MAYPLDSKQHYAHVTVSHAAVEFATARTRDPVDVLERSRELKRHRIELRNAEIVRHYTPTPEDIRCLRMAIAHGII